VRGRHALDERAFAVASGALEAAVRDRPKELSYWLDLGRAYVGKGDATRAIHAFEQASLLAPKEARPLPPAFAQRYGSLTPGDRGGIVTRETTLKFVLEPQ
jgi:hypothetical protein